MPTDTSGDYDLIARIHDWLVGLWTDPEAAAQFAANPAVSLAQSNLDQSALNQVNLRHIAGQAADAPGLPDGGRAVLNSFAHSPGSSSDVREVFHVTREVHHENPIIQKIFQDNSVHIDQSQTLVNNGIIDGNVDFSNNSSIAVGAGAVSAAGGSTVNAATGDGSVANAGGGDVNQASGHGQVIDGSEVGQNASNSAGSAQVGHDANGAVNTGTVVGTQAGGGATGNVTGSGNETATVGAASGGTQQGQDPQQPGQDPHQPGQGQPGGPENGHFGEGASAGQGGTAPADGATQPHPAGDQGGQQPPAADGAHGGPQDGSLAFGKGADTPAHDGPATPATDGATTGSGDGTHHDPSTGHAAVAEVPTHPAPVEVHTDPLPEPEHHDAAAHLQPTTTAEPAHADDTAHHDDHGVLHA